MNGNLTRRINTYAHLIAFDAEHSDGNVVPYHQ
jgi:hypothetical protein